MITRDIVVERIGSMQQNKNGNSFNLVGTKTERFYNWLSNGFHIQTGTVVTVSGDNVVDIISQPEVVSPKVEVTPPASATQGK